MGKPEDIITLEQFLEHAQGIEALVLGQSDVKAGIDPRLFPIPSFNFADFGESFIETYYKFTTHRARMPKLRLVILPVSTYSFSAFRTDRIRPRVLRSYMSWSDARDLAELKGPQVYWWKLQSYVAPYADLATKRLRRYAGRALGRPGPAPSKGDVILGYRRSERSHVARERAEGMVRHHFRGDPFDPHVLEYFGRLLELCHQHGLVVVTVACPLTDFYLEAAESVSDEQELHHRVLDAPDYRTQIDLHIDAMRAFPDRHEFFADQNHLNANGAEALTRLVSDRIAAAGLLPGAWTRS